MRARAREPHDRCYIRMGCYNSKLSARLALGRYYSAPTVINNKNFMHFHAYTVSSVDIGINVVSSRQGTFTVACTASGGTVVSSSLTGPGGVDLELQPVGSIGRTGQNTYSVTSGTLSGRSNGDTYLCTAATNLSSPSLNDSAVLSGIYVYIIYNYICLSIIGRNGTEFSYRVM